MTTLPSCAPISPLSVPLADPLLRRLFEEEPTAEALATYENDYARRCGYVRRANGEWITELRPSYAFQRSTK
jgi:hypothetical protein